MNIGVELGVVCEKRVGEKGLLGWVGILVFGLFLFGRNGLAGANVFRTSGPEEVAIRIEFAFGKRLRRDAFGNEGEVVFGLTAGVDVKGGDGYMSGGLGVLAPDLDLCLWGEGEDGGFGGSVLEFDGVVAC